MVSHKKPRAKIVVIVGQTAAGKSSLGVLLARRFGGEIISADSRQVYRGLDIGTGKMTKKEMRGVPHHLLDVANPKHVFTVAEYKTLAERALEDMLSRGKLPFIVGGTGLYVDVLLGAVSLPDVPPNPSLRKKLEKKDTEALLETLKKIAPERARRIDIKNRRRLIRAIEIAMSKGQIAPADAECRYDALKIGIAMDNNLLKNNIRKRLLARIKHGMVAEAQKLHRAGLSWKRMEELGLEYRFLARYLQGEMAKDETIQKLNTAIWQYARRQKTWFKRDKNIQWFTPSRAGKWSNADIKKIQEVVKDFLVS